MAEEQWVQRGRSLVSHQAILDVVPAGSYYYSDAEH